MARRQGGAVVKEHLLIFWQRRLEDAYRENYDLKAENARLKAEVDRLTEIDSYLHHSNEHAHEERCVELEAQVERLTNLNFEYMNKGKSHQDWIDGKDFTK
jgi:glycyl-tRNA synthetase beta subunit